MLTVFFNTPFYSIFDSRSANLESKRLHVALFSLRFLFNIMLLFFGFRLILDI